ncbi:hypothetical protein [Bacillus mobilis]|uniref:hypothetical protein n=1 Tax=Bacillus mobilis TaxID=2026190 RepID=UPI003CEB2430
MDSLISLLHAEWDFSRVHWGYWVLLFFACVLNIAIQFVDEDEFNKWWNGE